MQRTSAADLDRNDPTVRRWLQECELANTPVRMTLRGESANDINLQLARLVAVFGPLVKISKVKPNTANTGFVAYGEFVG